MLGGISSREDDDFCAVEVSFHDAAQHRRVPLLTDFYHFSMASLSTAVASSVLHSLTCRTSLRAVHSTPAIRDALVSYEQTQHWRSMVLSLACPASAGMRENDGLLQGALYASQSSSDAPSMLAFKPCDSWAPGSDWTLGLPQGEEAVAVAAGTTFCAAVTSKNCLRIISLSGMHNTLTLSTVGRMDEWCFWYCQHPECLLQRPCLLAWGTWHYSSVKVACLRPLAQNAQLAQGAGRWLDWMVPAGCQVCRQGS